MGKGLKFNKEIEDELKYNMKEVPAGFLTFNVSLQSGAIFNFYQKEGLPVELKEETVKNG